MTNLCDLCITWKTIMVFKRNIEPLILLLNQLFLIPRKMNYEVKILCLFGFVVARIFFGNALSPKIIGGKSIEIKKRPFMASFHTVRNGFRCGATIISENWVLTAFHCLDDGIPLEKYYLRAGSSYFHEGGLVYKIIAAHNFTNSEQYADDLRLDIVLLKVQPRFQYSKSLRPARLPHKNKQPPKTLQVSGWGITENNRISRNLMTVYLSHIEYNKCVEIVPFYLKHTKKETHLCYWRRSRGSCFGDSGGPLATQNTIYGIVSFGIGCHGRAPEIYTKVSFYTNWIRYIMMKN